MPSQKLRLEAEMKDNASPAVKRLRQELSELQAASADTRGVTKLNAELAKLQSEAAANASPAVRKLRAELAELQKGTAAQQAVASLNKEIAALRKQSGDIAPSAGMKAFGGWMGEAKITAAGFKGVIDGLPGVLGAIGLGALGAGASASKLAEMLKRAGENALDLKELSRETGMSKEFVNAWSHAGEHFGVAGDSMKGMLNGFASQLPDFREKQGAMFREFSRWPDTIAKITEDIEKNNPAKALMDALEQAEQAGSNPQVQKEILQSMGLGDDAEKLFAERLAGLRAQLQKPWPVPSEDLAKAMLGLRDATIDFNTAWEKIENRSAPPFLKEATREVANLTTALSALERALGWAERVKNDPVGAGKDALKGLGDAGQSAVEGTGSFAEEWKRRLRERLDGKKSWLPSWGDLTGKPPDADSGLFHKSSYGNSAFHGLLQNAAYTTGADPTSQFGTRGLVADGSKEGVLAALREWSLQSDAKGGLGGGGPGGSGGAGDAGESYGSGRKGFAAHGGRFGGRDGSGGGYEGPLPSSSSAGNLTKLIDAEAKRAGIDPRILEGIRAGESGHKDRYDHNGGTPGAPEDSWGPFQLNRLRGLGIDFERESAAARKSAGVGGLEDPRTIPMQTRWVAEYIKRHGRGALGAWHGYHGDRDASPSWRDSGYAPGADKEVAGASGAFKAAGAGVGAGGAPVDIAKALRGANESEAARGLGHYMSSGLWCADFVNGALAKSGGKGTGSSLARSFFAWGHHIDLGDLQKGDVLVKGSHVGLAEGPAQMHNGRMMIPMISGNYGHRVGEGWARPGEYEARRADGLALAQVPHPFAGRRADRNLGGPSHGARDSASDHRVTVGVEVTGPGHHKSTRVERNGALRIDAMAPWQTRRNPLLET